MKRNRDPRIENTAQAEAFDRMAENELDTISLFSADFSSVIRDYGRKHAGEIPTADDFLWIENQILNRKIPEE
jgi:hypothetical protein